MSHHALAVLEGTQKGKPPAGSQVLGPRPRVSAPGFGAKSVPASIEVPLDCRSRAAAVSTSAAGSTADVGGLRMGGGQETDLVASTGANSL